MLRYSSLTTRSRPLVQQRPRPYVLVIGGTDVNEHVNKAELRERMERAIAASQGVVAMHPDLKTRFAEVRTPLIACVLLAHPYSCGPATRVS